MKTVIPALMLLAASTAAVADESFTAATGGPITYAVSISIMEDGRLAERSISTAADGRPMPVRITTSHPYLTALAEDCRQVSYEAKSVEDGLIAAFAVEPAQQDQVELTIALTKSVLTSFDEVETNCDGIVTQVPRLRQWSLKESFSIQLGQAIEVPLADGEQKILLGIQVQ